MTREPTAGGRVADLDRARQHLKRPHRTWPHRRPATPGRADRGRPAPPAWPGRALPPRPDGSSLRARPAPSRQAATPTARASSPHQPDRGRGHRPRSRGAGQGESGSPPCAAIIARRSPAPGRPRAPPPGRRRGRPAGASPGQRQGHLDQVGGPRRGACQRLLDLDGISTAWPSGASMPVAAPTLRTPCSSPSVDHGPRQPPGVGRVPHERPAADLHVQDQGRRSLGDLLGHDRRGDERDRFDGPGDVTQRVQPPVRRGESGPAARSRSRPRCSTRASRRAAARPASRGWPRACPACRRCARGPGRTVAGPPPQPATSGARISETLSPTPPVECLSTVGLPAPRRSIRSPESTMAAVHARNSSRSRPFAVDRHQQRRHLFLGDLAAEISGDQPADVVARPAARPSRLAMDEVDGPEGGQSGWTASPEPRGPGRGQARARARRAVIGLRTGRSGW